MKRVLPAAIALLLLANLLLLLRAVRGHVRLSDMHPRIDYLVDLQVELDAQGDTATARVFLPKTNDFQTIRSERVESARLAYNLVSEGANRRGVWEARGIDGHELATYHATVTVHPKRFELPAGVPIPERYPDRIAQYLGSTETIQSDSEEIRKAAQEIREKLPSQDTATVVRGLYDFVLHEVKNSDYENTLDALTTLKWREAFCGGKSRLLAALLRASNIPARLVGGLILTPGSKKTTHAWVQAWVNGEWVPLDALNDHFAEHPANYLILYEGDHALVSRTKNINFNYLFNIEKWRVPPDEMMVAGGASSYNTYVFWNVFRQAHISLNLLRILLLLPVGVLIVILLRNVVGLATFGTFQPALLAVAFRETGFLWGVGLYFSVLVIGALLRLVLDRFQLLHTPRLAVLLTFIVGFMLAISYWGVQVGVLAPAHVSMFPIALLAITVEGAFIKTQERGISETVKILAGTLLAVALVYAAFDSHLLQAVVFVYPEVLLAVLAAYLLIGRWVGLRLFEYKRFRWLLVQ
ncbi:MAG: UUP1 family membrane protein [Bdellovibrionota bacterium]